MNKTISILATGLLQPRRLSAGLAEIRTRILETHPKADVRVFSWKQTELIPILAEKIADGWANDSRLIMAAHSWGSTFCCALAESLVGRAIPVAAMLLADAVARPPRDPLVIPMNVTQLFSWYQTTGVIKGSSLKFSASTTLVVHEEVHAPHHRVDEVRAFQDRVVALALEGG